MISICFRYDDASARSDHKVEQRVFEIFREHRLPLCVAAIPFGRTRKGESFAITARNAPHLADALRTGFVELAQHGHSHLHRANDAQGRRSEFAGVSVAEQTSLINEGKEHLRNTFSADVKGFVPPWNTYDCSTVRAVHAAGFEYLSGGFDVLRCGQLPIVPITCTLDAAQGTLEKAHAFRAISPIVVVVIHSDDFEEYRSPPLPNEALPITSLCALEALLGWIETKPHIRVEPLSRIAQAAQNGAILRSVNELRLPYRVRLRLPSILVRASDWRAIPTTLYGLVRSKSGRYGRT